MTQDVFIFPMSFAQQRLWFLDQLEPNSASYNIPAALRLTGRLNVAALKQTLDEIVARHELLRTTFATRNDEPMQVIASPAAFALLEIDLQTLSAEKQEAEVQRLTNEEAQRPFDLRHGPLLRVTLLRLSDEAHVLLATMHHIISDGWSIGVFANEIATLYEAFMQGKPSPLPELPIQYVDFALWQREWLSGETLEQQLTYWREQLAEAPPLLELPTDRGRPAVQTDDGGREEFTLNAELVKPLNTLTMQASSTLFMTLSAAFAILLARYSGQSNIVFGTPIANRNRREIEGLIGFFVNTLALHFDLSDNPTFLELLAQVRERALSAFAHQDLPFEKLVEELQPERNLAHSPIFQVMFAYQNVPSEELVLPDLTITFLESETVTAKFDMNLSIGEEEGQLFGSWEYNSDLFDASTIRRMITNFETLLASIVANPEQRVNQLPLLTAQERHQLLVEWNQTDVELPKEQGFHQLFESQVRQTPDAVAAIFEDQSLTYQQLNARANQWANVLIKQGVQADSIVGVLAYRGLDFLTAVLAIFKAGGAYLPLDPFHPAKRVQQVLEQSQAGLVLVAREFEVVLNEASPQKTTEVVTTGTLRVLLIEELEEDAGGESEENVPTRCTPDDLAYVIFTSGSTGTPKGAMVEQKGMLNHLYAKVEDLKLTDADTVAQNASQCFDISVWQFLAALLVGGKVVIFNEEAARDPVQLLQLTEAHQITILEVVPSLMRMMLDVPPTVRPDLSHLRWLVPTGEALPPTLCREWFAAYPTIPMINAYGPTECSDDVTHYAIYEAPGEEVINMPIGRPIANMRIYILDGELQPVPIGVEGELYVGGIGVGRGYLNDPGRTADAFMTDPFALSGEAPRLLGRIERRHPQTRSGHARLYKTGDKARYLPDGNIEFRGRVDFQVKIRGFRIELGEIEVALNEHEAVREVVVIAREDNRGDKRLVAYWVPVSQADDASPEPAEGASVSATDLRRYLFDRLPDYMVASAFVQLEAMPLTSNGKINRRALPAPDMSQMSADEIVAPQTVTQQELLSIWATLLEVEPTQLGINNNFFELGGHSLLATQLISRVRQTFKVELPLRTLFERPTIADFADAIEDAQVNQKAIEPEPTIGRRSRTRYQAKASELS